MKRRHVEDCVDRVEPEPVEAIFAEHRRGMIAQVSPHFIAAGPVEIYRLSPRSRVTFGQIRPEPLEVISDGSEMVVYDIRDNAQAVRVAFVDQLLEAVR